MAKEINVLFSDFDKNKDGFLCENELREALAATKLPFSLTSLKEFRACTRQQGYTDSMMGGLNEEEFCRYLEFFQRKLHTLFEEHVSKERNGLTRSTIENISAALGVKLSPSQLDSILKLVHEREMSGQPKWTVTELGSALSSVVTSPNDCDASSRVFDTNESRPAESSSPATVESTPTWITLTSGAIAGMTSRTLTAPLDRIKSLLQASVMASAPPSDPSLSTGLVREYRKLDSLRRWSFFHGLRMNEFYSTLFRGLFPRVQTPRAQMKMQLAGVGWTVQEQQAPRSRIAHRSSQVSSWRNLVARYRRRISYFMNNLRATNAAKSTSRAASVLTGKLNHSAMKLSNPILNATVNSPLQNFGQPLQANTVRQCISIILKDGGITAFWRGNGANVIKVMPESAVRFGAYEKLRFIVAKDPQKLTIAESFIAGAGAGAMAQISIYPLELIKTRMALASSGQFNGIADCFRSVLQGEGPRGLYRGLSASLVGMLPYSGVDLTVFSLLKRKHKESNPGKEPNVPTLLLFGATATTVGQVFAYPFQLVRTRLQAQGMANRPVLYNGILDCLKKSYCAEGFRGLYKGMLPNMAKGIPAVAISFATFEVSKRTLVGFFGLT